MSPQHQITMLKFIKNISMLATTHESLQNSNAIEVLTDLLGSSVELPQFREISNNVLHILFNLCRLSRTRQEDAALNGLIPLLQRVVKTERPLKELALPILCDMAHCGYVGRKVLWQNKGLQFYISLLADKYWQVTALDAILVWYDAFQSSRSTLTRVGCRKKPPRSSSIYWPIHLAKRLWIVSIMLKPLLMPSRTSLTPFKNSWCLAPL
jgi:hypothetical protein